MASYEEILNKIETSLRNDLANAELNDITLNKTYHILKESLTNCQKALASYKRNIAYCEDSIKTIISDFKFRNSENEKQHRETLEKIENDSNYEINLINNKIASEEEIKENKILRLKQEQSNTTAQTNPIVYNFILKRNNILRQYELYKKSIDKRYDNLVNVFSNKNEKNIQAFTSSTNKFMFRYNKANDFILSRFNDKLKEYENNLKIIDEELKVLKHNNDKKLIESEKIFNSKVININKNLILSENLNKNQYELEKQGLDELKKEQDEETASAKSKIFKEFITTIEKINYKIDNLNKCYKNHINFHKKEYHFKIFKINQEINKYFILKQKNKATPSINKKIKALNKNKKLLLKTLNLKLNVIEKHHKKMLISLQQKKAIVEDIKNYEIEKLTIIDEINNAKLNNKYVQLKQNYEYSENKLKDEREYKVMQLRCAFDKEKVDLLCEHRINQSSLFLKKEAIIKDILDTTDEIEYTNKIEDQVCINNKAQVDSQLEKYNITTLLEIEKNKFLKESNNNHIDLLSKKEQINFEFNEKEAFFNRDKRIDLLNINIKRCKYDNDHNKIIYSADIDEVKINEEHKKKQELNKLNDTTAKLKANNIYSCFIKRKQQLVYEFDLCKSIIYNLTNFINALSYFLIGTTKKLNTDSINNIFKDLYNNIISIILISKNNAIDIINMQINYETGSQYNELLNNITEKYENTCRLLKLRKNSLMTTIDNYNNASKQFYQNITSLENDERLQNEKYRNNEITKVQYKKFLTNIKPEIKRYYKLIEKNYIQIDSLKRGLNKIPRLLAGAKYDMMSSKRKLRRTQEEEASILINAIEDLKDFYNNLQDYFTNESNIHAFNILNDYITNASLPAKQYLKSTSTVIKNYYNIINNLTSTVTKKFNRLIKTNEETFNITNKDTEKEYKVRKNELQEKINNENNRYNLLVKQCNDEAMSMIVKYEREKQNNINERNKCIYLIDEEIEKSKEKYLSRMTSTSINISKTIENINKKIKISENNNQIQNRNLTTFYMNKRSKGLFNYNQKIDEINKNNTIIPEECKNHKKQLDKNQQLKNKIYHKEQKLNDFKYEMLIKEQKKQLAHNTNINHNHILKINKQLTKSRRLI